MCTHVPLIIKCVEMLSLLLLLRLAQPQLHPITPNYNKSRRPSPSDLPGNRLKNAGISCDNICWLNSALNTLSSFGESIVNRTYDALIENKFSDADEREVVAAAYVILNKLSEALPVLETDIGRLVKALRKYHKNDDIGVNPQDPYILLSPFMAGVLEDPPLVACNSSVSDLQKMFDSSPNLASPLFNDDGIVKNEMIVANGCYPNKNVFGQLRPTEDGIYTVRILNRHTKQEYNCNYRLTVVIVQNGGHAVVRKFISAENYTLIDDAVTSMEKGNIFKETDGFQVQYLSFSLEGEPEEVSNS